MRKFSLWHRTQYQYEGQVSHSRNLCMLLPRSLPYQEIHHEVLEISPQPSSYKELKDGQGNRIVDFFIGQGHHQLEVCSRIELSIQARNWSSGCESLLQAKELLKNYQNPLHVDAQVYLAPSKHIQWDSQILTTFPTWNLSVGPHELAFQWMRFINENWQFRSGVTGLHTSVRDLLHRREGVCQDFSHLMIAGLRALGIPARYVSGYIETLPKPGRPKLIGADVSHAWVQVYDPIAGWKDFDPTNNLIPSEQHATIAWGRDFADISPLRGVVAGNGRANMQVSVNFASID